MFLVHAVVVTVVVIIVVVVNGGVVIGRGTVELSPAGDELGEKGVGVTLDLPQALNYTREYSD